MSKVVNLRQARKAKARSKHRAEGDQNAALHGETKAQRQRRETNEERAVRTLDGAKRDPKCDPKSTL